MTLEPAKGEAELDEAIAALMEIGSTRSLAMLFNSAAYNAVKADSLPRAREMLERSESLAREADDQMLIASIAGNAGLAALFGGALSEAGAAFERQLRICRRLVIPWLASEGLAGPAAIAVRHGNLERAARTLGAASAHGPIGDPDVLARLDREFFAPARERLGERPWLRAHESGTKVEFVEAIDSALDAVRGAVRSSRSALT